jgi:sulfur-carrier protein
MNVGWLAPPPPWCHNFGTMAVVHFTSHLQSFVNCEPVEVAGETVGAALSAALAGRDQLRTYILDDQGRLRRHVMIFIDGQMIGDRLGLSDAVKPGSEVYVMQALSGG